MGKKINRIMVCIDFSDYTSMVMEYAVEIGRDLQIVLYNVINQRDVDMVKMVSKKLQSNVTVEAYIENLKQERKDAMDSLVNEYFLDQRQNVRSCIEVGIPSLQILQAIETEIIDMVVIGNKGKENIPRVLFGSAAEKVFRHSPVPVVSVRDRKRFRRDR